MFLVFVFINFCLIFQIKCQFWEAVEDRRFVGEKQREERDVQYLYGRESFACVDSFFDSVTKVRKEKRFLDDDFRCNEIRVQTSDRDLHYGLSLNSSRHAVPLLTTSNYNSFIDRNGSIIVNKMGTIIGGQCHGSLLFVEDVQRVAKGRCDSSEGVTQVDSYPNGLALLVIRGRCESVCVGRAVDDLFPGKRGDGNDAKSGDKSRVIQ